MDKNLDTNYAFIDSHNIICGLEKIGWHMDWLRFRTYLTEKYSIKKAFLFVGYIPKYQEQYHYFTQCGFEVVFKDVYKKHGNIDVELTMQIFIEFSSFHQAILVSNDGDFSSLIKYLRRQNKLLICIATNSSDCSVSLRKATAGQISFLKDLKTKVAK